jgi:hypothetical protein
MDDRPMVTKLSTTLERPKVATKMSKATVATDILEDDFEFGGVGGIVFWSNK